MMLTTIANDATGFTIQLGAGGFHIDHLPQTKSSRSLQTIAQRAANDHCSPTALRIYRTDMDIYIHIEPFGLFLEGKVRGP